MFHQTGPAYSSDGINKETIKGYATFDLIRFCIRTYTQIADSLGIQVLTIPKEKQKLI